MCIIYCFVLELGVLHSVLHRAMEILCIWACSSFLPSSTSKRKIFFSAWPYRSRCEPGSLMRKSSLPDPAPRGFPESLWAEISQMPDGNTCVKPPDYQRQGEHTLCRADFHPSTNIKGPLKAHH